jgi:hypothetical protein
VVRKIVDAAGATLVGELFVDHRAAERPAQVDDALGEVVVLLVGDEVERSGVAAIEVHRPVVVVVTGAGSRRWP